MFEAVEGDRVGFLVTNNLPAGVHTTIHWHGILLPIGMDGVGGLTQKHIRNVNVPTGAARDIEFLADAEGDWAFHCHKVHHLMNGMGHMFES